MRALFDFLLNRRNALIGFLLIKAAAAVAGGLIADSAEVWAIGVLAVAVYAIIARFAYSGRVISIWAITVLMLYEGAGALLLAWSSLPAAPGAALLALVVAAYLVLGALSVFSSRRADR